MAHAIFRFSTLSTVAAVLVARSTAAAPNALLISETPVCRVSLSKLSYDGPGADDEEFVELVVEQLVTEPSVPGDARPPPPSPPCNTSHPDAAIGVADAAAPSDARADVRTGALTLGDCGLGELRLVNGGAGACDDYRVIPLGSVVVPSDGFVLLCAQDSLLAASCNVNTAGRSALRNGFLQNGPADGLRFVDTLGAVALEVGYEGSPSCFSPGAPTAIDETGEASGSPGSDDVNVVCGGRFELKPASEAPMHAPSACPPPPTAGSNDADAAPLPHGMATTDSGSSSPRPEFAPDVGVGYQGFFLPDAGLALPRASKEAPLEPPSCRASPGRKTSGAGSLLAVVLAVSRFRRRRLRRIAGAPRARCSARCETALRRSP